MVRNHLEEDVSLNTPLEWGSDGDGALDSRGDVKHGAYNDQHFNLLILSFFIGIIVTIVICPQST